MAGSPKFTFTLSLANGEEREVSLPAKFEVCPTCQGVGSHVNRAIDGNGLSREDFDEDPDFAESYMRGDYDVACTECKGERVVSVVDENRLSIEQRAQWDQYIREEEAFRRDYESEAWLRRAESGERW